MINNLDQLSKTLPSFFVMDNRRMVRAKGKAVTVKLTPSSHCHCQIPVSIITRSEHYLD